MAATVGETTDEHPVFSRWGWCAMAAGLAVALVVVLVTDGPVPGPQSMPIPRSGDVFEIDLHDPYVADGTIERAWAVDPVSVVGDRLAADGLADLEAFAPVVYRDVGGYDAVVVYNVFPNCGLAPEIHTDGDETTLDVEVRSHGGCVSDSIRHLRAVAIELAAGVTPTEIRATHRDP